MTIAPGSRIAAVIFDVDGVLLDSRHERAWREALTGFANPAQFTTAVYQAQVAGKPRLDGARAALKALGVADADGRAEAYARAKQARLEALVAAGAFRAFPDALRFVADISGFGWPLAVASSSRNADAMLRRIRLPSGRSLRDAFVGDVCGRDVAHGKPAPDLFLLAAKTLGVPPDRCLVIEDAPAGIAAARAGGMAALGVARLNDARSLEAAGADLVVTTLDAVSRSALAQGLLHPPPHTTESPAGGPFDLDIDPPWTIVEPDGASGRELAVEADLTVANGFLGVRGAPMGDAGGAHRVSRRTYVAGVFETPDRPPHVPILVSLPDQMAVSLRVDDEPPGAIAGGVGEDRALDMRRGLLRSVWRPTRPVPLRVEGLRFASQNERGIVVEALRLTAGGDAEIALIAHEGHPHPDLGRRSPHPDVTVWKTRHSDHAVAVATRATLIIGELALAPTRLEGGDLQWRWRTHAGQVARLERWVSVARDDPDGALASRALTDASRIGLEQVLAQHVDAWSALWRDSGVVVEGDPKAQTALRFAAYHLSSAVNPQDDTVSVAARGLTGDGYRGHVFWDTEIYMLPFYVVTQPKAARALLMYRFHTLAAARDKARRLGWKGALYAWESTTTGEETTPETLVDADGVVIQIPTGVREQHISADIAYAVWSYWQATGDDVFLETFGTEILLETARFWASRARLEADGLRHIRGAEGPDEYHESVDDNAFTNGMAAWNLRRATDAARWLHDRNSDSWKRLRERLSLTEDEVSAWPSIADGLAIPRADNGLVEQFAGFFGLQDLYPGPHARLTRSVGVLLGPKRLAQVQVIKQADVVALIALLPQLFTPDEALANFRYYEPRCDHDSSLSPAMHALVAARLGDMATALSYFREAAAIDRTDAEICSGAGVHMATQGGLWQAAILGFGGLTFDADHLTFSPRLPPGWTRLTYPIRWRDRRLEVTIEATGPRFTAVLLEGAATDIVVAGGRYRLEQGRDKAVVVTLPQQAGV